MFWVLFLAHLIADYPLQPDRLVAAKKHFPGLAIHVSIQWIVMTLLTWPWRSILWPYILAIAIFHFVIDYFKVILGKKKPEWVIAPYLWDQPLHWLSLIIVCYWMSQTTDLHIWNINSSLIIYSIGILMVTHIWFVTERVMTYRDQGLQLRVVKSMWLRMASRLILFTLLVMAQPLSFALLLVFLPAIYFLYGYLKYSNKWVFIDVGVALFSTIFVFVILTYF